MWYRVEKDGKIIVRESALGLVLKEDRPLMEGLSLVRAQSKTVEDKWETVWGEERVIENNYNEMAFYLAERGGYERLITMRFRVFNDGVAFRYEVPAQTHFKRMVIADEVTEFAVDDNSEAWKIPAYQPDRYEYNYEKTAVRDIEGSVHTPLTIALPNGFFIAIHEAALYNYGGMTLKMAGRDLRADITPLSDGTRAHVELPFATPWRTIIVANNALDLTISRMMLNLNEAPAGDFSWVKPIKFMGIWWAMYVGEWTWAPGDRHGATTEHAIEYIDACKKLGIPALLAEGWNDGWEGDWLLNGAQNKFMKTMMDFDIDKVAAYARLRGVDLVGHHETVGFVDNYEAQLPEAYKFLQERGIRYLKTGYSGSMMEIGGRKEFHHSQAGVLHYQWTVEMCAKYGIMIDIHEPIKGTGIERTWPNLLTREGARGQEYEGGALAPSHACFLPFTRLLAGGMDYTSGIFDLTNFTKRPATTIARQVAYFVTIFSGMQMAADRPKIYEEHMDMFRFIQEVPVSFERTVPLLGMIGEYYVVARQGRGVYDWYVGGVTNEMGRRVGVYLDFLGEGDWIAEIYRDSQDAHYRDNPFGRVVEKQRVRREDRLDVYMAPGGGFAMRVRRATD
jgi:alpha-glucosidase